MPMYESNVSVVSQLLDCNGTSKWNSDNDEAGCQVMPTYELLQK